jgi:hypothetical protein
MSTYLKICEISSNLFNRDSFARSRSSGHIFLVSLLVPPYQEHPQAESKDDLPN